MFRRYQTRTIRSADAIAAEKAEKLAKSMTCQVCNRQIFAETGVIAHHGYQRPAEGWQTCSCNGARHVPFEVSRDALAHEIDLTWKHIEWLIEALRGVEMEMFDLRWTYADKTVTSRRHRNMMGGETTVSVNRETFPVALALYVQNRYYRHSSDPTFDSLKAARVGELRGQLNSARDYLAHQQRRFAGWAQTHERQGDTWVSLAKKGGV